MSLTAAIIGLVVVNIIFGLTLYFIGHASVLLSVISVILFNIFIWILVCAINRI